MPTSSNASFKENQLKCPGYTFQEATLWRDTGSATLLCEGTNLKDGMRVLAKIASAHSNGSLCLERESHVLSRLASLPESTHISLKLLEMITIGPDAGDAVVLILSHPGTNALKTFFPAAKINDLLLAGSSPAPAEDMPMLVDPPVSALTTSETTLPKPNPDSQDVMDIASFLEFAIQASRCLEVIHKAGLVHREIRLNAFHLSNFSGVVRLVHFGNRSTSLEQLGGPSALVLKSGTDAMNDLEKLRVKEALCALAPEQTSSTDTVQEDHRTDLYSLGIVFWMLLVGNGRLPFDGPPMELLHSIVQRRPMSVHECRRDVSSVLGVIVDKLLAKKPDDRYNSAVGLKYDLLECQKRLNLSCATPDNLSLELIPPFEIAKQDKYQTFVIPSDLFGRENELEEIGEVMREASAGHMRHLAASRMFGSLADNRVREGSVHSGSQPARSPEGLLHTPATPDSPKHTLPDVAHSTAGSSISDPARGRRDTRKAVIIHGSGGIGKSALILSHQVQWRGHGLWAHAKFQDEDSTPFASLLASLSSVLRQLMSFETDLHRFTTVLQSRLGPQLYNLPLLFQGAPELRDLFDRLEVRFPSLDNTLSAEELRVRFQSLLINVFCTLSEVRMLALFLDDLHLADQSTLDFVSSLVGSRSTVLVLGSFRSDSDFVLARMQGIFPDALWIALQPLPLAAVLKLVSKSLHRSEDDCSSLAQFLHQISRGNAFSVRNTLLTLQRAGYISFNNEMNWWQFSMEDIEESFKQDWVSAPGDDAFLMARIHAMPLAARRYLVWAALFGTVFKVSEVANVMEREDGAHDPGIRPPWPHGSPASVKSSVRGLHHATAEGWLVQRARDMCCWSHDRYRSAVGEFMKTLPPNAIEGMALRVVLMLMQDSVWDTYRIAEFARRCTNLLATHPVRPAARQCLLDAAFAASSRGALEIALMSYTSAKSLLGSDAWSKEPEETFSIYLRIVELLTWKGDHDSSDVLLEEMLSRAATAEDRARVWRARSRNNLVRKDFVLAVDNICQALALLGVQLRTNVTPRENDDAFDMIKGKILAAGQEHILAAPRCVEPQIDLCVALLNDAGTAAYWTGASAFMTSIGLTILDLMFKYGLSSGTALGFFWILSAATEDRELYRFSLDIAHLGLRIAALHGNSLEKSRAEIYFVALASGYSTEHLRANRARCDTAFKLAHAAGDRIYAGFARIYQISNSLFCSEDLNETMTVVDAVVKESQAWSESSDISLLAKGLSACVHALLGHTDAKSASTAMTTPDWNERDYLSSLSGLNLHWYACFKIACLYCLGHFEAAAELGYEVYVGRKLMPKYGLFWHSLALVQVARQTKTTDRQKVLYLKQIELNQSFIRKWQAPSPVNNQTWVAIVEAEVAALNGSSDAYRLYDVAVRAAGNLDWVNEEGWALFLQGSHFVRNGVESLGKEIQRRAVSRQSQWGANGIVTYMMGAFGTSSSAQFLKKRIFTADAATQTELEVTIAPVRRDAVHSFVPPDDVSILEAEDLRAILKATQVISSDINLALCLERLTSIAADICHAHFACVAMRTDNGDWALSTAMTVPQPCTYFENPVPLRSSTAVVDPLCRAVLQHTLNVQEPIFIEDITQEPRFATEASYKGSSITAQSILSVPMISNRGQTFGAIYLCSSLVFSRHDAKVLGLLMSQSSISISNALLFRSLQQATRGNLKAISAQKAALEETRRSREDALKATKIKSNFLASMSHELRTPFSSFYGLLDILSETALDASQRDIVATAKQSCELLLKIIDGILGELLSPESLRPLLNVPPDYSKLEASAVKLEIRPCSVEDLCADCIELVMPLAAQKLSLEHFIHPDVPSWVMADDSRIRQVLMNLLGNAIKFTASGSVTLSVKVERDPAGTMFLNYSVADTGIGLSEHQIHSLFVPFQQADNSSTRRFGGTGLGLSISKNLATLMGGSIDVESKLNAGSTFTFRIPVKPSEAPTSLKALHDIDSLRERLQQPKPPRILVCSSSTITLGHLDHMLRGFTVENVPSMDEAASVLAASGANGFDFVLVDHPDEERVEGLLKTMKASPANKDARLIHLFTPIPGSSRPHHLRWTSVEPSSGSPSLTGAIIRLSKPPRTARILGVLASLKLGVDITNGHQPSRVTDNAFDQTLTGNVLVAEDNDVARTLLVKQLSRYKLNVQAAANGQEAVDAWQAHEPGYFSVALFDHHMPIMDGVEATKQIRLLERHKYPGADRLPIVALSADCQLSTQALCLSAGMNGFLAKPLRKNDLAQLLTRFWEK